MLDFSDWLERVQSERKNDKESCACRLILRGISIEFLKLDCVECCWNLTVFDLISVIEALFKLVCFVLNIFFRTKHLSSCCEFMKQVECYKDSAKWNQRLKNVIWWSLSVDERESTSQCTKMRKNVRVLLFLYSQEAWRKWVNQESYVTARLGLLDPMSQIL